MKLIGIRHFKSTANDHPELVCGYQPDLRLSDNDPNRGQLSEGLKSFIGSLFDSGQILEVVSSPAVRCLETARLSLPDGISVTTIEPRLAEVSQGEFETKTRKEVYTPKTIGQIEFQGDNFKPPGGESLSEAKKRISSFYKELSERYLENEGVVILFGHGLVFKLLLADLFGLDREWVLNTDFPNGHYLSFDSNRVTDVPSILSPASAK